MLNVFCPLPRALVLQVRIDELCSLAEPAPIRKLNVTHRAQSMAIDDTTGELFLSVQYPPQVAVYDKMANGDTKESRLIEGPKTNLSDVHGLAIDGKNKLLYLNSWGNISDYKVAGTGRFEPASIEEDLGRRDFSVHAMALSVVPARRRRRRPSR